MTWAKRSFDLVTAIVLGVLLLPILGILMLVLLLAEGRPIFFISQRMATPERPFGLVKLRTMRPAGEGVADTGGVTGGDKGSRMSGLHRFLRKTRLDEIPQLWNVFRGDMSFVGPRPPLPVYVAAFPDLYRQVLHYRPGITGMASLVFHGTEERLLAQCSTASETDEVYRRRCIPRKAWIDLIYGRRATMCSDILVMLRTVAAVLSRRS